MTIFALYRSADDPTALPVAVSERFSWFAALLPPVHALVHRLWDQLGLFVLGFGAIAMHRRLLWFAVPQQAIQVLPLFVAANVLQWLVRMAAGDPFPGIANFLSPVIEALLWPVVTVLLLAPQRRAPDPDQNRPL